MRVCPDRIWGFKFFASPGSSPFAAAEYADLLSSGVGGTGDNSPDEFKRDGADLGLLGHSADNRGPDVGLFESGADNAGPDLGIPEHAKPRLNRHCADIPGADLGLPESGNLSLSGHNADDSGYDPGFPKYVDLGCLRPDFGHG
jgi:hypothetical protein